MKPLSLIAAAAVAMLPVAASAAINVSIYLNQPGAASNATIAQAGTLTADATIMVGAINFNSNDSTSSTVGAFLNNPGGLSAAVAGATLNNTYFLFTGSTFLNAGANAFVVPHDDGVQLDIAGFGLVIDQPGPTSAVNTPFNVNAPASGFYNFTLAYGETAGGPAVLAFTVNGAPVNGVPEPETWALMVGGFGLIGASLRRRTRAVAA